MMCFFTRECRLIEMTLKRGNGTLVDPQPELLDFNFGTAPEGTKRAQISLNLGPIVI